MLPANCIVSNTSQSTLTDKIRLINQDRSISKGSKILGIEIIVASNWRGYCWHSIEAFCNLIASSESQVHLYLRQLQENGYIDVVNRPGRTNYYYLGKKFISNPSESPTRGVLKSTPKIEIKNKDNVTEKTNVIFNFTEKTKPVAHSQCDITEQIIETKPPSTLATDNKIVITSIQPLNTEPTNPVLHQQQKPIKTYSNIIDMNLVQQILQLTGDRKSTACFIKIVKNVPKNVICAALSSLKITMNESYISRPGAYFVSTIKNYYPDVFAGQKTCPDSPVTKNNSILVPLGTSKKQCFEQDNIIPASPEVALEAIGKIKLILNKPGITSARRT